MPSKYFNQVTDNRVSSRPQRRYQLPIRKKFSRIFRLLGFLVVFIFQCIISLGPWVLSITEVTTVTLLYFVGYRKSLFLHPDEQININDSFIRQRPEDLVAISLVRSFLVVSMYSLGRGLLMQRPYLYTSYLGMIFVVTYCSVKWSKFDAIDTQDEGTQIILGLLFLIPGIFSVLHVFTARGVAYIAVKRFHLGLDGYGYPWESGVHDWQFLDDNNTHTTEIEDRNLELAQDNMIRAGSLNWQGFKGIFNGNYDFLTQRLLDSPAQVSQDQQSDFYSVSAQTPHGEAQELQDEDSEFKMIFGLQIHYKIYTPAENGEQKEEVSINQYLDQLQLQISSIKNQLIVTPFMQNYNQYNRQGTDTKGQSEQTDNQDNRPEYKTTSTLGDSQKSQPFTLQMFDSLELQKQIEKNIYRTSKKPDTLVQQQQNQSINNSIVNKNNQSKVNNSASVPGSPDRSQGNQGSDVRRQSSFDTTQRGEQERALLSSQQELRNQIMSNTEFLKLQKSETQEHQNALVVLVHGFGGGVFQWRKTAQSLANELQTNVVAYDRPAFGLTERKFKQKSQSYHELDYYSLQGEVCLLIRFLKSFGNKRVIFVGHSDGCLLVLLATAFIKWYQTHKQSIKSDLTQFQPSIFDQFFQQEFYISKESQKTKIPISLWNLLSLYEQINAETQSLEEIDIVSNDGKNAGYSNNKQPYNDQNITQDQQNSYQDLSGDSLSQATRQQMEEDFLEQLEISNIVFLHPIFLIQKQLAPYLTLSRFKFINQLVGQQIGVVVNKRLWVSQESQKEALPYYQAVVQQHDFAEGLTQIAKSQREISIWEQKFMLQIIQGIPTFLITGEQDSLVPCNKVIQLKESFKRGQIFLTPKSGHFSHEEQPQIVVEAITQFMNQNYIQQRLDLIQGNIGNLQKQLQHYGMQQNLGVS